MDQTTEAHRRSTVRNRVFRFGRGGFRISRSDDPPCSHEPKRFTMDTTKIAEEIDWRRRYFVGAAAVTAAAQLGTIGSANARSSKTGQAQLPPVKPGTHTSFAPLKQIDAGVLNVAYAEA